MELSLPVGGTVRGVGADIIECERIAKVFERQGERFLSRVFTEGERSYCLGMANPIPHLAARFAAKEAVSKCFRTGIGAELGWKSVEVVRADNGAPSIRLDSKGLRLLGETGCSEVLITLSHTALYANAVAILVAPVESVEGSVDESEINP